MRFFDSSSGPHLLHRVLPLGRGGRYLRLDLASRYRWYVGPLRSGLIALCLALVLWIGWTIAQAVGLFSDLRGMQARLDQVRGQDAQLIAGAEDEGIDLSASSLRQLPAEVELANQLLGKRNFSWTQFLTGLEDTIPQRVSIRSVGLDPASAMVHLTGAAVTVEDVTALTMKLRDHPVFNEPALGQHHTGGDGLVEFELSVKYHPQGM